MNTDELVVIPARIASKRFPRKPLALIAGKTMLQRVHDLASAVPEEPRVIIATDSEDIFAHAKAFGAEVVLTSPNCATGSDRVSEAAKKVNFSGNCIINLQGDSPLMLPSILSELLQEMRKEADVLMATPVVRLCGDAFYKFLEKKRKGCTTGTTAVFSRDKNALFFSKGIIPHQRAQNDEEFPLFLHLGLYAYRPNVLHRFAALPPGMFEQVEKLEQLRALENGIPIRVVEVNTAERTLASVDSPEDLAIVERIIQREGEILCPSIVEN